MKTVVQRVQSASVSVDGSEVGAIGRGLVALVGFGRHDDDAVMHWMANRIASLRVFADDQGKMSRSVEDVDGSILVVSQFTLYGDCRKGNRPSFDGSAPPAQARELYERFLAMMKQRAPGRIQSGRFQEMMAVSLVNDGPVTLIIERDGGAA